ncbi:MAG: glycosyltransferase family 2 protein [Pseudomonadota bacterium]
MADRGDCRDFKVAICAVFKDENRYVREWLEYHASIGIDYFLMYDNMSAVPLAETISDYIDAGVATVIDLPGTHKGRQTEAYAQAIERLGDFEWAAFIDIDEFVVLLEEATDIKAYLKRYDDDVSSVGLHWLVFGANGHLKTQDSVLESYTQSCPNSYRCRHIKTILRVSRFERSGSPHYFFVSSGRIADVRGNVIKKQKGGWGQRPPILNEVMRVNHYATRSRECFELKKQRGGGNSPARRKDDDYFDSIQTEDVQNHDILQLVKRIKSAG